MAKFICQLRRGTLEQWLEYEASKYIQTNKYYTNTTYYLLNGNNEIVEANPQPTKTEAENGQYYIKNPQYLAPLEGELVLEYDDTYDGAGNIIKRVPRLKIGTGIDDYSALPYMSIDSFIAPTPASITLYGGNAWRAVEGFERRYVQDITGQLAGLVTPNSKIDLQPTPEQLYSFQEKDVTFTTVNEGGAVRVCAIGERPLNDYEIQITITEVISNG